MVKLYMKILYVNDKNADTFDKVVVDQQPVFAKYFSPSCPACIAMETEWNDMCKEIYEKYDTDLLLAQIDPTGMEALKGTHTYNQVEYVPNLVILEHGKKVNEYNGDKKKYDMIHFLLENGYLQHKIMGGSKKLRKNTKRKNTKRTNTKRTNTKRTNTKRKNTKRTNTKRKNTK